MTGSCVSNNAFIITITKMNLKKVIGLFVKDIAGTAEKKLQMDVALRYLSWAAVLFDGKQWSGILSAKDGKNLDSDADAVAVSRIDFSAIRSKVMDVISREKLRENPDESSDSTRAVGLTPVLFTSDHLDFWPFQSLASLYYNRPCFSHLRLA